MDKRCKLGLKCLPTSPCAEGRKAVDAAKKGEEAGCPWFVASEEAHYCFFALMAQEGRPMEPAEIARLLYIDDAQIKKDIQKFRKIMLEELQDLDPGVPDTIGYYDSDSE
ncbi:MAG: hypothetical protein EBU90_23365 [Proteobacteria bacterium]|nr:hypothetical protein [Pseudomonadota bacterium]